MGGENNKINGNSIAKLRNFPEQPQPKSFEPKNSGNENPFADIWRGSPTLCSPASAIS